jgi:tetratricopeptide (TPR) repeat protein
MAVATLNPGEESQLLQTIEMFEVIVQSQPSDTQSLEILKEAYSKLGREEDVVNTSKRIAEAYMQQGQLSSAILEYETILQRRPDDRDVLGALKQIEHRASSAVEQSLPDAVAMASVSETMMIRRKPRTTAPAAPLAPAVEVDDGRKTMHKIFVETKLITAGDFDLCWRTADLRTPPVDAVEPFIQILHDKGVFPIEKSLRLLAEKSRVSYLPLDRYEVDIDLTRTFPAEACRRWCVLPFDRMSKAILVATANPFNQQAAKDLAEAATQSTLRLLWYVAAPNDLTKNLRKAFR